MTEKRFVLVCDSNIEWLMQTKLFLPIKDKNTNKRITLKQCCDLLNSLADENGGLKQQLTSILKLTEKIEDCTHDMKLIGE